MLGKLLEGAAWFATLALATVGTLAFLPDGAWESFPTALRPARAKLAEFGVAPTCYRADCEATVELASNDALTPIASDEVWQNATTVRIGERWKDVRKVGETSSLFDNERGNFGAVGANLETGEEPTTVEGMSATDWGTLGSLSASERSDVGANVADAQTSTNAGPASVDSGSVVDEDWEADAIPPFDAGNVAAENVDGEISEPLVENVDNRNVDGATKTEGSERVKTASVVETNVAAETQTSDGAVGGGGFEDFGGVGDFNAPAPLLAEADAALPNEAEESVASNSALTGDGTVDLQNALAAASTASTPEEIKAIFETLNRIRDERGVRLGDEDAQALNAALDRLAFDVFYNPAKAILEPNWQTELGESLASIAERLGTTPETLAEINGIKAPVDAPLPVGTTLKTVRGPASAEISISKKELTLRFNGLYAGRFALGVPESSANLRGEFRVVEKLANPNCDAVDANGQTIAIPGGAPENPLGAAWIALDGGVGLQGTNRPELVGQMIPENGGFVFSNREISQLSVLLPVGAVVAIVD